MKRIEGSLVKYMVIDGMWEMPPYPQNEVFIPEEGEPNIIKVRWENPDDVFIIDGKERRAQEEYWIFRPKMLHMATKPEFKYELEPEHPEKDS
jgi:hypothetical protein